MQKSEFYSHCEGANVPSEFIPWHSNCGGEDAGTCELGSSCEETDGNSYCKPASQHIPHSGSSRNLRGSKAAAIGIGIGVLALLALAVIGAFGASPSVIVLSAYVLCALRTVRLEIGR